VGIRNNALRYWTLTEMIVPRFVGTGRFLTLWRLTTTIVVVPHR